MEETTAGRVDKTSPDHRGPRILGVSLDPKRSRLLAHLLINGLVQGLSIATIGLLAAAAVDLLSSNLSALPLGRIVALALALLVATASKIWLRFHERVAQVRFGDDLSEELRSMLRSRLSALTSSVPNTQEPLSTDRRFAHELSSVWRWWSFGIGRLVTTGLAATVALVVLALWSPQASGLASLILFAGVLAILNHLEAPKIAGVERAPERSSGEMDDDESWADRGAFVDVLVGEAGAWSQVTRALASGLAIILATGAVLVAAGGLRTGSLTAAEAVSAVVILVALVPALFDLRTIRSDLRLVRWAARRIRDFLDAPSLLIPSPGAPPLLRGSGRLVLEDVVVLGCLKGFSAEAEAGSVVAVVGSDTVARSTLLALAARLIDPDEGTISLDGQALSQHSVESARRLIGRAGPHVPLVKGTIEDNIRVGWPDAPAREVARVRRLCSLDDVAGELSQGKKTIIDPDGVEITDGQRMCILLARALVGHPPILVIDESGMDLDPRAISVLERVISGHMGTVLVITSSLDRVAVADAVWHLENGRLLEVGPPPELLALDGPTARLFGLGSRRESVERPPAGAL